MKVPRTACVAFLLTAALWAAPRAGLGTEPPGYDLRWGVRIPMRDGVELHATLYIPKPLAKTAAVFNMTPYSSDGFHGEAAALARRGFVFAAVDVRGRGNSDGRFEPWRHDGRDGHDVAEWLASRPWSTGKVGMMGHSYGGRAVWSTLKEAPPHLAAAMPISASYPMRSWNNVQTPDGMQWIVLTSGVTANSRLLADSRFWWEKFRELYFSGRPLRDFDEIVGFRSELYQKFYDHATLDDFWDEPTPRPEDFRRLAIPILTVTGAYDTNSAPLWYYDQHLEHRGRAPHFLVVGPWGHHGTLRPRRESGGLEFGPESLVDVKALIGDWFDFTLRGGPRPALLEAPVRYYLAETEVWRSAESLAELEADTRTFALARASQALTLTQPGDLVEAATGSGSGTWTYDPLDVRPGEGRPAEAANWLTQLDWPEDLYGAGVAYATKPFAAPVDLAGRSRLSAWIRIDVPDTDIAVRLDLLTAEGATILLGEDIVRVRHRNGLGREELAESGEAFELRFVFPFMARTLPEGSRLRLIVRSPSSIFWGRHFNSGRPVADQSKDDARTAHVELLHDAEHPSRLAVPSGSTHKPIPRPSRASRIT